MGYFNYFIKCVIRKFVNTIFKPKVFLVVFITICVLYLFGGSSRAEWTDDDVLYFYECMSSITSNQGFIISQLSNIGVDVSSLKTMLDEANDELYFIRSNTTNINANLIKIYNQLNTITTSITDIYNKLDENQQELLTSLEEDNQAVLEELNMIRDAINGSEEEQTTYNDLGIIPNVQGLRDYYLKCITLNYEPRYTYTIKVTYSNPLGGDMFINVSSNDNLIPNNFSVYSYQNNFIRIGTVPPNTSNYTVTYNVPTSNNKYIYLGWGEYITKIEVFRSIKGITESLNDSNSLQQQQNQLQQEGNQLQQEQNDFLKDDNVNTDGFEFATDDTVNPTADGFNTLFTSVYNAFCNTSSAPLTVTLPFVNQTFTISPNLVSNAMQKCGLSVVVTLINSYYYYCVCLFIYKDINKIIEHLKSGNITADCGNVKTEVL